MSENHSPRAVEHDPTKCAAYGCPMLGSMTASTSGTNEWLCWVHFGKEAGQWQAITAELNRVLWLVQIVRQIRFSHGKDTWPDTYRMAKHTLAQHQRNDLQCGKDEAVRAWLQRLDSELGKICGERAAHSVQAALEAKDTWSKVSFDMPTSE